jgi:hypothetical protein
MIKRSVFGRLMVISHATLQMGSFDSSIPQIRIRAELEAGFNRVFDLLYVLPKQISGEYIGTLDTEETRDPAALTRYRLAPLRRRTDCARHCAPQPQLTANSQTHQNQNFSNFAAPSPSQLTTSLLNQPVDTTNQPSTLRGQSAIAPRRQSLSLSIYPSIGRTPKVLTLSD